MDKQMDEAGDAGTSTRSLATRESLISSAMRLFGQKGFDGVSTRMIADNAKTNVASISYHFGGKEGLRRACGEAVGRMIGKVSGPVLEAAGNSPDPRTAEDALVTLARTMADFILTRPQTESFVPFMLREVSQPGPVFAIVYESVMRPLHMRVCRLWAAATGGDPESPETRLEVFSLIGQLLYFRIGREIVIRRMGWERIGQGEAAQIMAVVETNIRAAIAAHRATRAGQSEYGQ